MRLTAALLQQATGCSAANAAKYAEPLTLACEAYEINTPERLTYFLATIGHESGSLRYATELWGPTPAQRRYEGREDLGNTEPGDGERFKGHGLIQTTGRYNHRRVRDRLRARFPHLSVPDFEANPEALALPLWAALSAADFIDDNGINKYADNGDFDGYSDEVNRGRKTAALGDSNGWGDRLSRLARAQRAVSAPQPTTNPPPLAPEVAEGESMGPLAVPLIGALANSLIEVFTPLAKEKISKELARHSDNPEVVEQVANNVVEVAKQLTGKEDPIEAVVEARKDPVIIEQVQTSVLDELERMGPLLDKLNAYDKEVFEDRERSVAAARQFNADDEWVINIPFLRLKFIHLLSIAFVCFSGWFVTVNWSGMLPELRGAVITLMVIAGWNGVRDYWMGSSRGSSAKDVVIGELAKRK